MSDRFGWIAETYTNDLTGAERKTWRRTVYTAAGHKVHHEVYELAGRYYWSANIMIMNRPDLSRIAYGVFAVTPQSLSFAKGRATRIGNAALKAAKTPRHMARAA